MKKLCIGSLLTVLKLCKAKSVTQKKLCGTVLLSVAPLYDIREDDGAVHDLLFCEKALSPHVSSVAPSADARQTADYIKQHVLPMLDENLMVCVVLALKDIIADDESIKPNTTIDRVGGHTKADILVASSVIFEDMIAGLFLYVASFVDNNDGKPFIREVNASYLKTFEARSNEIVLIDTNDAARAALVSAVREGRTDMEVASEIADGLIDRLLPALKPDNSLLLTLIAESNGNCIRCGNALAISRKGAMPSGNCKVVYLTQAADELHDYESAVVLCESCLPYVPRLTAAEKASLLENKRRLAADMIVLDEASGIKIAKEIESVLREIDAVKNETELAIVDIAELVEIERKISELYLRNKINASMVRLFKTVNEICARLEQEIGFNTERFGRAMKFTLETIEDEMIGRKDITDPQEYITNALIAKLYTRVGQKYQAACEIVVAYLIKRCDLFNENAQ